MCCATRPIPVYATRYLGISSFPHLLTPLQNNRVLEGCRGNKDWPGVPNSKRMTWNVMINGLDKVDNTLGK